MGCTWVLGLEATPPFQPLSLLPKALVPVPVVKGDVVLGALQKKVPLLGSKPFRTAVVESPLGHL
eukprot:9175318-Lingulodinium_polyedra.AAC.1